MEEVSYNGNKESIIAETWDNDSSDFFTHLMGVVQRVLPFQEHSLLLGTGEATCQPRRQGAG